MQPTSTTYPVRLFIRHKAQQQIIAVLAASASEPSLDAQLFHDVVNTVLQPQAYPAIYESHASRDQAEVVEDEAANAIVSTYLHLWQRQQDAEIQRLNQLLQDH
ncbi:MAG: hypothetical protein HC929_06845 [Leptolyngbyaceae cyanobacterium SM2_5_2]|nr:hypothetical protein [Leptolyngbyaceae cyanobacterium SM2_5_2]